MNEGHGYGIWRPLPQVSPIQEAISHVPTAETAGEDSKLHPTVFWKGNTDYDSSDRTFDDYSITDFTDRQFTEEELAEDALRLKRVKQQKLEQAEELSVRSLGA